MNMLLMLIVLSTLPQVKVNEARKAEQVLSAKPDDRDANTTLGKYLAFTKGEWDKAMPFLAKGKDEQLKTLAMKELERSADRRMVGDAWWGADPEKKQPVYIRLKLLERAVYWYSLIWPEVDAKGRGDLRERFKAVAAPPAGYERNYKSAATNKSWGIPSDLYKAFLEAGFTHGGMASVRVLPPGKDSKDGLSGFHCTAFPVTGGKPLVISFWVFTDRTDVQGSVTIRFYDITGKHTTSVEGKIPSDSPFWQRIDVAAEVPPAAVRVDMNFCLSAKIGGMWVDDVLAKCDGNEVFSDGFEK